MAHIFMLGYCKIVFLKIYIEEFACKASIGSTARHFLSTTCDCVRMETHKSAFNLWRLHRRLQNAQTCIFAPTPLAKQPKWPVVILWRVLVYMPPDDIVGICILQLSEISIFKSLTDLTRLALSLDWHKSHNKSHTHIMTK